MTFQIRARWRRRAGVSVRTPPRARQAPRDRSRRDVKPTRICHLAGRFFRARSRIAQQISHAFGLEIDKDVVRRILANHALPTSGDTGPSWLSALAEARDSLWSVDLFRCESILLKSFWVMVVTDVYTRRIVGFVMRDPIRQSFGG
jgi:hypothetical protein